MKQHFSALMVIKPKCQSTLQSPEDTVNYQLFSHDVIFTQKFKHTHLIHMQICFLSLISDKIILKQRIENKFIYDIISKYFVFLLMG